MKIVLIGGQSNAVGLTEVSTLDESERGGVYNNVYLYQEGNFEPEAKCRIIRGVRCGMGCKTHHMGIEYGIARVLDSDGPAGLIRFAYGGTDLTFHWQTEFDSIPENVQQKGWCFYEFVGTVKRGLAAYKAAGYDPTVVGMVWMQGESDTNKTAVEAEQYEDNLSVLFSHIRNALGTPDLKIIVGGISTTPPLAPFSDTVRRAQKRCCDKDPNAVFMDNSDLPVGGDGWHYNGKEDLELGLRFGDYIKKYLF